MFEMPLPKFDFQASNPPGMDGFSGSDGSWSGLDQKGFPGGRHQPHLGNSWSIPGLSHPFISTSGVSKPGNGVPQSAPDRLGAQLRCGHIRTQVTWRTHRFCLTGQGPHIVISVCSRAGRHLVKLWFTEHSLDQHQPCLSPVYVLSDVPAQKFKKADKLCSGTPSGCFLHMLALTQRGGPCFAGQHQVLVLRIVFAPSSPSWFR